MYNRFYIRTDEWLLIGDNRGEERSIYDLQRTRTSSSTW